VKTGPSQLSTGKNEEVGNRKGGPLKSGELKIPLCVVGILWIAIPTKDGRANSKLDRKGVADGQVIGVKMDIMKNKGGNTLKESGPVKITEKIIKKHKKHKRGSKVKPNGLGQGEEMVKSN